MTIQLVNPGFEGEYVTHGAGEVKVANGWTPFWSTGDPPKEKGQGPCKRPEYKPATLAIDSRRVMEGDKAQCWFLSYAVMDGGIFQRVPVPPNTGPLTFSVSAQAWCTPGNDPLVSDWEMYVSLGIDPLGRVEPFELGVVWSPWEYVGAEYRLLSSPQVVPQGEYVTVFIRAWNKYRGRHNDIYVDGAVLVAEGGGEPDPDEPGEPVDYDRIRAIVREELANLHLGLT